LRSCAKTRWTLHSSSTSRVPREYPAARARPPVGWHAIPHSAPAAGSCSRGPLGSLSIAGTTGVLQSIGLQQRTGTARQWHWPGTARHSVRHWRTGTSRLRTSRRANRSFGMLWPTVRYWPVGSGPSAVARAARASRHWPVLWRTVRYTVEPRCCRAALL
jgi:hypothetical protein